MSTNSFLKDRNILIIGGTGSIGKVLLKKTMEFEPNVVRVYSRDEYKQFLLMDEMADTKNLRFLLGDIRDKNRLNKAMSDIDVVFNLAAIKHVLLSEYNPFEAVKTNVIGVQNLIDCAIENNIDTVIHTSTDKAISPTNTMGATKLLGEKMIIAANYSKGKARTKFTCVRFGNVLGTRGSVLPLFREQIKRNKEITVTDKNMTRFIMNIKNSVDLIIKATEIALGGEVFILKMPIIRLEDFADAIIEIESKKIGIDPKDISIRYIGAKIGEKMYEELMTREEAKYAYEISDMFVVLSENKDIEKYRKYNPQKTEIKEYSSNNACFLIKDEIVDIINSIEN
jgi:UDP-N-acetylglucosamine 4,6-dehydratase